ncbi:MAG: TlpA family protein disulfide reductase [Desulfovibrionales bacterium]|nr:TlpA family protein disulfide reductase [Desulfovibrionales bacterium]
MNIAKSVLRFVVCFVVAFAVVHISVGDACAMERVTSTDVVKLIGSGKGKVTVVNFWASWCPPCREEMPELKKTRNAFPADQLKIIGISVDENATAAEEAVNEFALNYPVYLAAPDVYETFGIQSIPRLLVYDTNGKLVADQEGAVAFSDLKKLIEKLLKGK